MPIGEQSPIASHTGNGVATVFAYSFGVLAAADIKVLVDGVEVTTGFTVSGVGSRTGGTVTFSVAPANGADILIVREVVRKRDTDYQYSGDLREEVLDDDFDRIWMALQEDGELVQRGVRAPVGETLGELAAAASRANKVLTFGPGGAIALVDISAFSGGGVVELVPADGSIALVKLTTAVQALINGALQKSGGDMTGLFKLFGNATDPLHPVPLQQAQDLIDDSALVSSALSYSSLSLSATGLNANVSVSAGELLLRSATGAPRLVSGVNVTIDSAASGANGLDTGTLSGSTWYAVWVIWNGTTTAGLLSLSSTAPTMPSGYTHKARVGWARPDGTANKFPLGFTQTGRRVQYKVNVSSNVPNFPQMASGTAGDTSAPAFATIAVGNFVPPTAGVIDVLARIGNASSVIVAPNGQFGGVGSSANPAPMSLIVNATTYGGVIRSMLVLESTNIYWACVGGGVVCCVGWEDNL